MLAQLVALAFNVYGLGLFVYVLCSWVRHPKIKMIENWLKPWYEPLFERVRRVIKPIPVGKIKVDITPMIILIGIVILRKVSLALLLIPY